MHSIAVSSHQQKTPVALLATSLKIIIPVLAAVYAYYHLSTAHLILLSVSALAVLMISDKMDIIRSTRARVSTHSRTQCFDGGTFQCHAVQQKKISAHTLVRDGGSFKRASYEQ